MGEGGESNGAPASGLAERALAAASLDAHVELLLIFLARRGEIVERIQGVLNAQRQPVQYLRDWRQLARHFEDCFFATAGLPRDAARLRGQLEQAHWAHGFKPREIPGMHNDLIDPAEMMRRGFHLWAQTRWPGRNGRVRYAQTLFNLYLLRQLALLAMRVWDDGPNHAGERLAHAQRVLDELTRLTPSDQPVLVRDARWLIPVAQSPATDELAPYYDVAEQIAESFAADDRIEIQKAVVCMAGGHLRSYLHYYVTQKGAATLDDHSLVLGSRKSNALDFSQLVQGLVPLLAAYERAVSAGDRDRRLELADAICQGISPDPELFVNHADVLGAYSMIEHFFTTTDAAGRASYSRVGERHVRLLEEYQAKIGPLASPLLEDCARFRPAAGTYSPYGVLFGFSSNLLEHMALKALQPDAETRFGLEDVFTAGGADKLAWVVGWRKLPHVEQQVEKLYAYPQEFAEHIFARIERALQARAERNGTAALSGRLYIASAAEGANDAAAAPSARAIPDLPIEYVHSSDAALVATHAATERDAEQLQRERLEAHYLVSYETAGGWVAISKDFLTEILAAGRDVKIAGLPAAAAERLTLMCGGLAARLP